MCHSAWLRKGLRVLVVDSDADSRELLRLLFESYGVETIVASCVSESVRLLQQFCPDLLISEIALPGEDGYSLMNQVKTFESVYNIHIPAIALTVCARKRDRMLALAAGFCQHLPKPLDIDELLTTVASLTQPPQTMSIHACC